jgi:hypothetical protein
MSAAREDSPRLMAEAPAGLPDMRGAEEALGRVRQQFEHAEDPQTQGALAAEALEYVEQQLKLTRERRRELDGLEGRLWTRRNRLERFLIHTRGIAWWQARRNPRSQSLIGPTAASLPLASAPTGCRRPTAPAGGPEG